MHLILMLKLLFQGYVHARIKIKHPWQQESARAQVLLEAGPWWSILSWRWGSHVHGSVSCARGVTTPLPPLLPPLLAPDLLNDYWSHCCIMIKLTLGSYVSVAHVHAKESQCYDRNDRGTSRNWNQNCTVKWSFIPARRAIEKRWVIVTIKNHYNDTVYVITY